MAITNDPGIYMLRNKLNGATYVGAGKKARARVFSQIRSLMRGDNTNELLQADWSCMGPGSFEIHCVPVLLEELYWLEMVVTRAANALEERGGYNKAMGRVRTVAARLRDTERKLVRSGKFKRIRGVDEYDRISRDLTRSFCQQFHRLSDEVALLEEKVTSSPEVIQSIFSDFEVFEVADLVGKPQSAHGVTSPL